jgi:hypothetical protein
MSLIFTPTIDIHAIPAVFNVFFGYFAFTPGYITFQVKATNLRPGFPEKSVITHPISQNHISPGISLRTSVVNPRGLPQP